MAIRTEFSEKVIHYIQRIPHGKVCTYGRIAKLAGKPHGSRGVAWLLHSSTKAHQLPWHRVIQATGRIPFPETSGPYRRQVKRLEAEGIEVQNGRVDLEIYLWKPTATKTGKKKNHPSRNG